MTPQFNLLRSPHIGPPYHEWLSIGRHDIYLSLMLPGNSYLILRIKKGDSYLNITKVQDIFSGEN